MERSLRTGGVLTVERMKRIYKDGDRVMVFIDGPGEVEATYRAADNLLVGPKNWVIGTPEDWEEWICFHELTADNVNWAFRDSLFQDGEPNKKYIKVEGIMDSFGFHPERLESHRLEVLDWISQLPPEFLKSGGGGWSFLNLCNRADGQQWADDHKTMQALCCLAIGLDLGRWLLLRDFWSAFPGGMPYVQFGEAA